MDEIYEAMLETVAIKDGDRFMAITEHASTRSPTDRSSGWSAAMIWFRSRCFGPPARPSTRSSRCTGRSSSALAPTQVARAHQFDENRSRGGGTRLCADRRAVSRRRRHVPVRAATAAYDG